MSVLAYEEDIMILSRPEEHILYKVQSREVTTPTFHFFAFFEFFIYLFIYLFIDFDVEMLFLCLETSYNASRVHALFWMLHWGPIHHSYGEAFSLVGKFSQKD